MCIHIFIKSISLLLFDADKVQVVSSSGLHQRWSFVLSALSTGNFQVATLIICQGTPLVHDEHVGHGSQQQVVLVLLVGVPVKVINPYWELNMLDMRPRIVCYVQLAHHDFLK